MDRQEQIELLFDHYEHPRYRGDIDNPDVDITGGNPGCADRIKLTFQVDTSTGEIAAAAFTGDGCTVSIAATSMLLEALHEEHWTIESILDLDTDIVGEFVGVEAVRMRPRCALLGLGTLKAGVRAYLRSHLANCTDAEESDHEYGIVIEESPRSS